MKKVFLLYILAIALSVSSCGFLDLESPIAVEKDKVFQDADGLRSARIGMYAGLASADYYGGTYPLTISCYSDDGANGGYSVQTFDELGNKTISSTNELIQKIWISAYNTNLIANQILANVDRIEDPTLEVEERNNIKAEALFVRALCHFDVLRTWGEHWDINSTFGIPIIKTPQAFNEAVTRSTVKQSYDFIINDLFQAEKLLTSGASKNFVTKDAVKALVARVSLYKKDNTNALKYATDVITNGTDLSLLPSSEHGKVFTTKTSSESIFEVGFNTQNRSQFNQFTYVRPDALRPEVVFLAAEDLNKFFEVRKDDVRANLVDYKNIDVSIAPDGRTEKYRGEQNRDNPAYVLRVAEMYLIAAEAAGATDGLSYINTLREKRGMAQITSVPSAADFKQLILDERRAELNWEGHRYYDLARMGEVENVLGMDVKPVFPIPIREITASGGSIIQNKGF